MQDEGNRTVARRFVVIAGFKSAGGAVDDQLRHFSSSFRWLAVAGIAAAERGRPTLKRALREERFGLCGKT